MATKQNTIMPTPSPTIISHTSITSPTTTPTNTPTTTPTNTQSTTPTTTQSTTPTTTSITNPTTTSITNPTTTLTSTSIITPPKKKSTTSTTSKQVITISGLDIMTSRIIIQSTSAIIGIFVFVFVPILANSINKPIASVILNVVPNDLILSYFIVEDNIEEYLLGCIFSPILNVVDNLISYWLYVYVKTGPSIALWSNIIIWILAIILSYIFI